MVTGGGLNTSLSAGVRHFLSNSGRPRNGNWAILNLHRFMLSFVFFLRQLQQQQQIDLEGGGTRDGLYEAGQVSLSQVYIYIYLLNKPRDMLVEGCCCGKFMFTVVSSIIEQLSIMQNQSSVIVQTLSTNKVINS